MCVNYTLIVIYTIPLVTPAANQKSYHVMAQ
jgi:hypothetical protein